MRVLGVLPATEVSSVDETTGGRRDDGVLERMVVGKATSVNLDAPWKT